MNRESVPVVMGRGVLRLIVERAGDRHAHRLEVADTKAVILSSVEGAADEDWPASPPLQELQSAPDSIGPALLVGMAGRSHWSQSAELRDGPPASVHFDVACRLHAHPSWLGSTYRLGDDVQATIVGDTIELSIPARNLRGVVRAIDCRLELLDSHLLRIAPQVDSAVKLPVTARWRYTIEIAAV